MPTLKQRGQRKELAPTDADVNLVRVFESENGKKALAYLEAIFYNNSCFAKGDSYFTHYKVGQQDVVGFIKETIDMVKSSSPIIKV
jgi:hypothetical protein